MEIDKNKLSNNAKAMLFYCLCVLLFFIMNEGKIYSYVLILTLNIINSIKNLNEATEADILLFFSLTFIVSWHIYIYITVKICGLFKRLDNLKIYITIPIIMLINIGFYYFDIGRAFGKHNINLSPIEIVRTYFFWILPIYFLIYKFFGFLTKKYPFPFERIGYYTSIEFIKDTLFKIKKRLKF